MKLILMTLLLMGLISCSIKKQNNSEENAEIIELTDSDELLEESDELALTDESLVDEGLADETLTADSMEDESLSEEVTADEIVIDDVASQMEYTVEKGDTLMMIAFKIYGDYSKWREIAKLNQEKLIQGQIAPVGTKLNYYAPSEAFTWNPEGNPYLVKNGDTLGGISTNTYGTMKYWKNIWDNNRPLIQNPNKIYAGFTIYTPVMEGRDVATK